MRRRGETRMRAMRMLWVGMAAVAVVALMIGLALFQPWRLFTTVVVDDALPPSGAPAASSPPPTGSPAASSLPPTGSPPPPVAPSPAPVATSAAPAYVDLARGDFVTHEHGTTGSARIVQQPDGSRVLAIEGLATSDGPDLHVWLTDQPVVEGTDGWHLFDDGRFVDLGQLKGNVGDQVYDIPSDVDLAGLQSVSIWCVRFAVSFGAATLA